MIHGFPHLRRNLRSNHKSHVGDVVQVYRYNDNVITTKTLIVFSTKSFNKPRILFVSTPSPTTLLPVSLVLHRFLKSDQIPRVCDNEHMLEVLNH